MKTAPKIPEILKFPVSLDLFLRYTAGGKYKGDRLKKYRAFLAFGEQVHSLMIKGRFQGKKLAEMPKPTLAEVGEIVTGHRTEGFRNEAEFWFCANAFRAWLAAQPTERARHAAKTRWNQERRHKANAPKVKALLDIAEGK